MKYVNKNLFYLLQKYKCICEFYLICQLVMYLTADIYTMTESEKPSPNLPWVEKYRPNALDELISHEDIINTIRTFIKNDKLPHLLFYGPPGTGKTSTILACAKVTHLTHTSPLFLPVLVYLFYCRKSTPPSCSARWCWS